MHFVVAANDMQRDLIFPRLLHEAWADAIDLTMELRPSGVPSVGLLRDARCDLILTPLPPDAPDLIQRKLFTGALKVFFDPEHRTPPKTLEEYLAAEHVAVHFALGEAADEVIVSTELTSIPKAKVSVSNFAGIPPFLLGTRLITTQFEFMSKTSLSPLDMADLPFQAEPVSIYMVWHQRSTNDPAHKWMRERIHEISRNIQL